MPTAHSLLPHRFEDGRHTAIEAGAAAAGFKVRHGAHAPRPGDILLTWNLYAGPAAQAQKFKAAGADVVVCEESYIRVINGEKYFALGRGGHNGAGVVPKFLPERWGSWGIDIAPWRADGDHILVCGQRGFGYNAMAMPDSWPDDIYRRLRKRTDRPLWFRAHPKRRRRETSAPYDKVLDYDQTLESQLRGAWAAVVYTSNCATKALLRGIPVFYDGPSLITDLACDPFPTERDIDLDIEDPYLGDRAPAFNRLAVSQWSMSEIRSGEPFRHYFNHG